MLDSKLKMMNLKKKNEDVKSHNSLSDNESGKPEKKGRNNAFDGNKELNLDFSIGTFGVNMPR